MLKKITMPRIRVMHVLATGDYSGAENVAVTIIDNTKETADSVYVSPDGRIHEILLKHNIVHYRINGLAIAELNRAVKIIQPELIHAHDFRMSVLCSALKTRIPIISHLHNNAPWLRKPGLNSAVYAVSCLRYAKILTVSDCVMDDYVFGKYFRHKSMVIKNPIDSRIIIQKSGQMPQWKKKYDLAFLGRMSVPKNPAAFVEIVYRVCKEKPDLKAVMIGNGELYEKVKERICCLGLEEVIDMAGFQTNPYRILKHAKILCIPSLWEGFGLAAAEAMALGKPVICSGAGGLKDIVRADCGKICAKKSEYVREICCLIFDSAYYAEKSNNARKRAKELDNLDQYIESISLIYQKAVKNYENTV